jgi:hypothetical protein
LARRICGSFSGRLSVHHLEDRRPRHRRFRDHHVRNRYPDDRRARVRTRRPEDRRARVRRHPVDCRLRVRRRLLPVCRRLEGAQRALDVPPILPGL